MDADLFTDGPSPVQVGWGRSVLDRLRSLRCPQWLTTLEVRLALGGVAVLVLGVASMAWQFGAHAEHDLLAQAQAREQADAQRVAAEVGRRLQGLQDLLALVARRLDVHRLADPAALAGDLDDPALRSANFASVHVAAADGRVLVWVDAAGARHPQLSLAGRAHFQRALRSQRATLSGPRPDPVAGDPVLLLAQPVLRDGVVVAVIGGAIRLDRPGPLRDLAAGPTAGGGVTVVLADADGTVLAHPERRHVSRPITSVPRLAAAWRLAQEDAAGAGAAGTPSGNGAAGPQAGAWTVDGDVVALAVEGWSGWQVWRLLPQPTVLAPLLHARVLALRDVAVLVVVVAVLIVLLLRRQLRPLARLERRAAALLTGDATGEWPQAQGEIGRLARTLQHVWAERSQMESFNQQVLQKLGSVMAAAPVGLAFTRSQTFELVSAEFCHLLGHAESELLGQRMQMIFVSNEDHARLGAQVAQAFAGQVPYGGEWQLLRGDGSRFWGLLRARPVQADDPSAGSIWSVNDVTEQVHSRRDLERAAHHDALTGVVNRQGFEHRLQALFDRQPASRPAALVMIDLDHFKPINDTAGHAAGDAMLVAVAQAIASRVRDTDVVVRLGGDEFALLLQHCTHDRAMVVAEKVREAITGLALTWEAHTLRVGASLGVAELAEGHETPAQWLAQADAACYEAKRAGRNTVRLARATLRVVATAG
jgi:diguanylate cyclase (GGDEF)-like protein/PAS domain S-box-containing protein